AFGLRKPLMFISTNDYLSRIPNTAKYGYPIVNLNSLDEGGWNSFCRFCLYVTGYNMSLINMCLCIVSVFSKVLVMVIALFGTYAILMAAFVRLIDKAAISQNVGIIENSIIIIVVTFFVVTYFRFISVRIVVGEKVKRIIGKRSFDLSIAPTMLTYNLRRAD